MNLRPTLIAAFVTSCLITAMLCSCDQQRNQSTSKTPLELIATLGGTGKFLDSIPVIYIVATVYNPTSDTVFFISMSCSYEDYFVTDTSAYKVQSRYDCYVNAPFAMAIPPKSRIDHPIMVARTTGGLGWDTTKFKIGMYYVTPGDPRDYYNVSYLHRQMEQAPIIWSNEIDVKRLFRQPY